jgi:hypothetical protein
MDDKEYVDIDAVIDNLCREFNIPPMIGTERSFIPIYDPVRGRYIIYPTANLARWLRRKLNLKVEILSLNDPDALQKILGGVPLDRLSVAGVAVRVTSPDGDSIVDVGVVPVRPVDGLDRETARAVARDNANALMRAVTKAERRAIFKLVGLPTVEPEEVSEIPEGIPAEAPAAEGTSKVVVVSEATIERALQPFENLDLFEDVESQ